MTEAPSLIQIRQGYRTRWHGMDLSIERGSGPWSLEVRDAATGRVMYAGQRMDVATARVAAAEFAAFHVSPPILEPAESLAGQLPWHPFC